MNLTIELLKNELNYDVNLITHVIANRANAAQESPEQSFNFSNTDGESELTIIDRFMESAFNKLLSSLSRYVSYEDDYSENIVDKFSISYVFELLMPETFNKSYLGPIRSSMHQYMVNYTLFLWFLKTKPEEAMIYKELSDVDIEDIRGYLSKRTKMLTIRPYPHI